MRLADVHTGQKFGRLIVRRRVVDDFKTPSPNLRKRVIVQCDCGSPQFRIPVYYLVRRPNPKLNCGECADLQSLRSIFATTYGCWTMMRVRCNDPLHVSYEHYGGRGIKVHPEWDNLESGFEKFLEHIGPRPSLNHSVDRINNDTGYIPGNVRWATPLEQANNKRPRKS